MAANLGLAVLFAAVITSHATELYDPCKDGANADGICTSLKECDSMAALLRRVNRTSAEQSYIKKSDCGIIGGARAVCCPLPKKLKTRFGSSVELPPVGVCGKDVGKRIVGGHIAALGDYPWLARIQYHKPNKRFGFHCGGVLINERYVLTAAHCIQSVPSSWTVFKIRLGEYDSQSDLECNYYSEEGQEDDCVESSRDYLVASYYTHEDYFQENGADYNDIALIRLAAPVEYTEFIQPICLPVTEELQNINTDGHQMTVAGWGQTEERSASQYLMYVNVPGWANERCQNAFNSVNVDIIDTQLCAGGSKGEDSCRGDSGGPLMKIEKINKVLVWVLKGIVSFGTERCGTEDVPGVYTRVSKYMDWILENIEE